MEDEEIYKELYLGKDLDKLTKFCETCHKNIPLKEMHCQICHKPIEKNQAHAVKIWIYYYGNGTAHTEQHFFHLETCLRFQKIG